jgi:tRNA G26 N,N-dimethylase Trm1
MIKFLAKLFAHKCRFEIMSVIREHDPKCAGCGKRMSEVAGPEYAHLFKRKEV